MSLTSYRAAPPRGKPVYRRLVARRRRWCDRRVTSGLLSRHRQTSPCPPSSPCPRSSPGPRGSVAGRAGPADPGWIGRPGGDLLSRALRHSTMGAGEFHGRVRDGIGCRLPAMATRSSNPSWGQVSVCGRRRSDDQSGGSGCVCARAFLQPPRHF